MVDLRADWDKGIAISTVPDSLDGVNNDEFHLIENCRLRLSFWLEIQSDGNAISIVIQHS